MPVACNIQEMFVIGMYNENAILEELFHQSHLRHIIVYEYVGVSTFPLF